MIGSNPQEGIAGYGDTLPEALRDLANELEKEVGQQPAAPSEGGGAGLIRGEEGWLIELSQCEGNRDKLRSVLRAFHANLKQQAALSSASQKEK